MTAIAVLKIQLSHSEMDTIAKTIKSVGHVTIRW